MSLMEVILAIFIFSAVMMATVSIFSSSFNGYKKADRLQKNIESAQNAMNLMTKSLRTSRIYSITSSTILAYDYSEAVCNKYVFDAGGQITRASSSSVGCAVTPATPIPMTTQYVFGSFTGFASVDNATPTADVMGRVTIVMKVCSSVSCPVGGANDSAVLQTTVSLRDYSTVGL